MKRRRVKITGIGPVTPAGIGRDVFSKKILESVSYIKPFSELGSEFGPFVAGYIPEFKIGDYLGDISLLPKGATRQTLFAVAGAVLALQDADISLSDLREANCVIAIGSSIMDFGSIGGSIGAVQQRGPRAAHPRVLYGMGISSVPSALNDVLGTSARTMALSTQCNAGLDAIGYAADKVAIGEAEIAICGGTEAPLHKFPMLELRAADLTPATTEMHQHLSRPFDLWRTTGVVSEGASIFIIEPEASPRRGYSYISGYAFGNDPSDDFCAGMSIAAKLALAVANIRPIDVDAISAWGPGHKLVDKGEARAMKGLFGDALFHIPVVSIKGAIGTALGAAPAIQVAAAALAQRTGILPPTVNWKHPDPECGLNLSNHARHIDHQYTLVNSHGAGGINTSIVLERC